jgi:arabinogalactan oligomer / maltooligosaccharide transport system permease protein
MATGTINQPSPSSFVKWWQHTTRTRSAYLYLVPAFLVMGLITFYPMFYQLWMSTTDYGITNLRNNGPAPHPVGIQNYLDILPEKIEIGDWSWNWGIGTGFLETKIPNFNFLHLLGFNLIWTFANVPFHVVIGVLIAVLLNTEGLWFRKIYRALYIVPLVLPWLVIATVWKIMYDQNYGSINQFLALVGGWFNIPGSVFQIRWLESLDIPIPWLFPGVPLPLAFFAMLLTNIWVGWPWMTIIASGALQSIPKDLFEAADMDGATDIDKFFNITVPLIRPAMVPAIMYGIITTFNLFNCIFMMSGGGPLQMTQIMVTTAYDLVRTQRLYGLASAFCVIIFVVLLILTLLTNQVTKATERYDA